MHCLCIHISCVFLHVHMKRCTYKNIIVDFSPIYFMHTIHIFIDTPRNMFGRPSIVEIIRTLYDEQ